MLSLDSVLSVYKIRFFILMAGEGWGCRLMELCVWGECMDAEYGLVENKTEELLLVASPFLSSASSASTA
ncbi:hypothetical protein AA106556_0292 [Neokomagataea tanensis NBRC 106556]|uniref:Uncharacterized protein n=1 Tax=Neokomagataea tanensis NBRC 106556 TaxID=1223519 RepID=A0ABQ0QGR4_9PROT|nr:hypothetical protein AA106556_0292 [Neokomagataea tanensis NBRC 106556]